MSKNIFLDKKYNLIVVIYSSLQIIDCRSHVFFLYCNKSFFTLLYFYESKQIRFDSIKLYDFRSVFPRFCP